MKSKTIIFSVGLVVLAVAILAIGAFLSQRPAESDAVRFNRDYQMVGTDNVFKYVTADEAAEVLKSGTDVVFFGFSACPWCQAYSYILYEVAQETGVSQIYYCDILDDRTKHTHAYEEILQTAEEHLSLDEDGNHRVFVPAFAAVKDGVIIGYNDDTSRLDSEDIAPVDYWTNGKVRELKQKLEAMIRQTM